MNEHDISTVRRCSAVIDGFGSTVPEGARDRLLDPIYSKGGKVRWISPSEAIAVLPSESALGEVKIDGPARITPVHSLSPSVMSSFDSG
jgi:hypothetical protein